MRRILVVCCLLAGLAYPTAASAVVRGANVPAGDAPYAVALLAGATGSAEDWQRVFCGGSLVDARTVLTAAHCAVRVPNGGAEVLVGRTNLLDSGGQRVRVLSVATHPAFDATTFRNDVALLRLASPVRGTPVTLGAAARDADGAVCRGQHSPGIDEAAAAEHALPVLGVAGRAGEQGDGVRRIARGNVRAAHDGGRRSRTDEAREQAADDQNVAHRRDTRRAAPQKSIHRTSVCHSGSAVRRRRGASTKAW